jgi:NAD(P)H-dependent flavin oxidoreductase YrpB (nitropropane dioxygenase family)
VRLRDVEIELPVVQAGMGGGLSGHELAAAVSQAGGLGTIAPLGAEAIAAELAGARRLTGRPVAVNLLLPFARRNWFRAAAEADVVVTFWGKPKRRVPGVWLHQCGSVSEVLAARAAGADAVIAQGVESGGHVRGVTPAMELLERVRAVLPADYPVLLAGGIAERPDVSAVLEAGAAAAVCGTRFLLSAESNAHPLYLERLLEADRTVLTELFGAGWPAPHRVVPNAATERQLARDQKGPALNRALNRILAPGARFVPAAAQVRMAAAQRPGSRILGPAAPLPGGPESLVDAGALYAGETVKRIEDIRPAAELVRALTP